MAPFRKWSRRHSRPFRRTPCHPSFPLTRFVIPAHAGILNPECIQTPYRPTHILAVILSAAKNLKAPSRHSSEPPSFRTPPPSFRRKPESGTRNATIPVTPPPAFPRKPEPIGTANRAATAIGSQFSTITLVKRSPAISRLLKTGEMVALHPYRCGLCPTANRNCESESAHSVAFASSINHRACHISPKPDAISEGDTGHHRR